MNGRTSATSRDASLALNLCSARTEPTEDAANERGECTGPEGSGEVGEEPNEGGGGGDAAVGGVTKRTSESPPGDPEDPAACEGPPRGGVAGIEGSAT